MGRPPSDLEDYRQWQRRLERYQTSQVDLDVFCLQEGVSRSTFYRWKRRLCDGIPEPLEADSKAAQRPKSNESLFLPVSLKTPRVEIELPNGGMVRLPSDVSKDVLVAVVRVVGSLRPWKAPQS
jgi:hypothetical protein